MQAETNLVAAALRQAAPECSDSIDRMTPATEISDLGLNSIKLLEAAAYLEEAAKASFPDDRLAKVVKVQDLIQLVREHGTIDPQAFNEK